MHKYKNADFIFEYIFISNKKEILKDATKSNKINVIFYYTYSLIEKSILLQL